MGVQVQVPGSVFPAQSHGGGVWLQGARTLHPSSGGRDTWA